jgi:hypothetical protein
LQPCTTRSGGVLARNASSQDSLDDGKHGATQNSQYNCHFEESFVSTQDDDPIDTSTMARTTSCNPQDVLAWFVDFNPLDIERRNCEEEFEHDDISDGNTYSEDSIKVALARIKLSNKNVGPFYEARY